MRPPQSLFVFFLHLFTPPRNPLWLIRLGVKTFEIHLHLFLHRVQQSLATHAMGMKRHRPTTSALRRSAPFRSWSGEPTKRPLSSPTTR